MSTVRKKIVPTLLKGAEPTGSNAFKQAAEKKNPLDSAADLIASRYGVSDENIPQITQKLNDLLKGIVGKGIVIDKVRVTFHTDSEIQTEMKELWGKDYLLL